MLLRWLTSGVVRNAIEIRRGVLNEYRLTQDSLESSERWQLLRTLARLNRELSTSSSKAKIQARAGDLRNLSESIFERGPSYRLRENLTVILAAIILAASIRTFFAMPFKIPTASMQPTLAGDIYQDLRGQPSIEHPTGLSRVWRLVVFGERYIRLTAKDSGELQPIRPATFVLGIIPRQDFYVGDQVHSIWFPPAQFLFPGVRPGRPYAKGEDILNFKVVQGDHLFADRLTYNFRPPRRGEILMFVTTGIERLPVDQHRQYFTKRLVGLPRDRLSIGNDRHLRVNGDRLDASWEHFEGVFSFRGRPKEGQYAGYLHDRHRPGLAPLFANERKEYFVRPGHVMVFGDNSVSSDDSRTWGDFPRGLIIGRAAFVYWPYSERFGVCTMK